MKMRIAFISGLLLISLAVAPCWASDSNSTKNGFTLEPVVVTAEKRAQDAQNVPAGITVMDKGDIEDMKIDGIRDLSEHVPNMDYHDFGSRRHGLLFMRGIKSLPGGQAGTGFTLDGLSYSKAYMFMGLPLLDVDRIEVLRGAQGTLYGRNTTGGVVNIFTAEPGNEFTSDASVTYGNYGNKELRADMSGPLVDDTLYIGLYALVAGEDSYMTNDVNTDGDSGRYKKGKAGRIKLMYTPNDDWKTTLSIDGQEHNDGSFPLKRTVRNSYVKAGKYAADGRYHYSHDFASTEDTDTWNVNLNSRVDTNIGTFHSITGYQNYRCTEWIDADMSPDDALRKRVFMQDKDLSQEFRLTSQEGNDDPLKWITGVYLFYFDDVNDFTNDYGSDHPTLSGQKDDYDTKLRNTGSAAFGEGTYTFFSRLDLTLGLRGEYEHTEGISSWVRYNGGVGTQKGYFNQQHNYTALLPKMALAWHFTDDVMGYGSAAKAHKVGGYNAAWVPSGAENYDEEDCWLYEVGLKSLLLDKRLMLNLSAFYTYIENEQLPLFVTGTTQGYLANAGKSHRTGVELESRYRLTGAWTLKGSAAWIDARFDEYVDTNNNINYNGKKVFGVPEYTYNLGVDYRDRVAGDWTLFGYSGVSGYGPQYFDNGNEVRQDAYELVNLRLGVEWKSLTCSLWAKNVFDEHYIAYENTTAGFAEDGRPRTFGATLSYAF